MHLTASTVQMDAWSNTAADVDFILDFVRADGRRVYWIFNANGTITRNRIS